MPYSENTSVSSFRPVDYNDLELTFTSPEHKLKQKQDDFKLSLQSMDDSELDDFRRSLITPMALSKIQDPMYKEFERTREIPTQHNVKINKRQPISPTTSYSGSVADSLAVFNRLIDDHSDDLVQSDLKDYMSPYDMDDLVSLPQRPTSSSPQMNGDTILTSRYKTPMAPIGTKGNHQNTPKVTNATTYLKPRKVSIDASVQTPSFFDASNIPVRTTSKEKPKYKKPITEPIKKLQPTESRRWSSYIPEKKNAVDPNLTQQNKGRAQNDIYLQRRLSLMANNQPIETQSKRDIISDITRKYSQKKQEVNAQPTKNNGYYKPRHSLQRDEPIDIKPRHSLQRDQSVQYSEYKPRHSLQRDQSVQSSDYKPRHSLQRDQSIDYKSRHSLQREIDTKPRHSLQRDQSIDTKPRYSLQRDQSVQSSDYKPRNSLQQEDQSIKPTDYKPRHSLQRDQPIDYKSRHNLQRDYPITSQIANMNINRNHVDQHKHGSTDTTHTNPYSRNHVEQHKHGSTDTKTSQPLNKSYINRTQQNKQASTDTSQPLMYTKPYNLNKRLSSSGIPTPITSPSAIPIASTSSTQLKRARSLTVPSTQTPSMMPTFRQRKPNTHLSKYASVPEHEPSKPVRTSYTRTNDIQPVASHSSSGQSNTTSSSYSEDTDPPTPPGSYIEKRNRVNKYGYYTSRPDTEYRRQRVLSEDNNQYKQQTKDVTESARELLAQVKERRAKSAAILHQLF